MEDAKCKLIYVKDVNEVNLLEHPYCQVQGESKQKDCGIEHISDNTQMVEEGGLLIENFENAINIGGNSSLNKTKMSNTRDGFNGKIICAESQRMEKNICRNIVDLCCGGKEEGGCVENLDLKNITVNWSPAAHGFNKRKSHKSYVTSWGTQISSDGYAKCLIETCNFISLDVQTMQDHYKTCDGIPNYDYNFCDSCKSWLPNKNEFMIHESRCRSKTKGSSTILLQSKDSNETETNPSEFRGDNHFSSASPYCASSSVENNTQMLTEEGRINNCDECDQEFLSDTDYSQHLICKRNPGEVSHTTKKREGAISATNTSQENINYEDSHIVQPGRHISKGEYVRRRAYTKQHKTAWEATIKKYKYVKCIFQNCHFLALSVEDMISHYGYCNGDGSFAQFVCPFCGGRLTSKNFLEIHIRRSHSFEQFDENELLTMKILNDDSQPSLASENKESFRNDPICLEELDLEFPQETPLEVEVAEEHASLDCQEKTSSNQSANVEPVEKSDDLIQDSKSDSDPQTQEWEDAFESSQDSTSARSVQDSAGEELNLLQEHNREPSAVDNSLDSVQKSQYPPKICNDREYRDDHIYSKRKIKSDFESESKDSLSVMKNKNSKHYSGRKHVNEETSRFRGEETLPEKGGDGRRENEEESPSRKSVSVLDASGTNARKTIKAPFPAAQNIVKREIQSSYTSLWSESIKANGFARCLVATCNFISLDILHVENHFRNCNGVPENGPNLCTFCNSRLPSAVELWIHTSMCRANGEGNPSSSDVSQSSAECKKDNVSKESSRAGESSNTGEMENRRELNESENKVREESYSSKGNKDASGGGISPRKEKMNSLRISDIMKLKDNGTMDYNRIIQPGPDLPQGHYVRRRSYTKTHKAVWEAALEKHKYVKCIFQNCHFLAMSLEDMIYHFGYCIGDGSFAKYECPHCGGRLTTKVVLDIHIQMSHSDKSSNENDQNVAMNNEEGAEVLPYTLDDWKKLMAKKELKTYGKNSPRSRKVRSQTEEAVATEQSLEASQDNCSSPDDPPLPKWKCRTETASEEVDKNLDLNKSVSDSTNSVCDSSTKNRTLRGNVGNTSSELQTSPAPKRLEEPRSGKTDDEGTRENNDIVTGRGKGDGVVEIQGECDARKDTSDSIGPPESTCNNEVHSNNNSEKEDTSTHENPNDEEMASDGNGNNSSLVLEKNSNTEKQETECEKRSLRSSTKLENKNSNKNDQKTRNDTRLRRKRGRSSKSLSQEDLSENEPVEELLDQSDGGGTSHEANNPEGSRRPRRKLAKIEPVQSQSNASETPNPTNRKRGRPPTRNSSKRKVLEEEAKEVVEDVKETPEQPKKGRRGRKGKSETQEATKEISENKDANYVKCASCGFETKRQLFSDHNYKKHVGLSWIEGEDPIDLNDEGIVSWNVKQAFKHVKSATCGKCGSVKKSALGFISHIQNCGKSEEEKDALKVKCPHCPARILKYSLPMHLKLSHSDSEGNKPSKENILDEEQPSKRKSALRAVNKFCEVLRQEDDEEETKKKVQYVVYEKGVSKFPKLPGKIRSLWNKMVKDKKKIPCRRGSCLTESSSLQEARNHHFLCSELPRRCYVCQLCDFYTESKASIQQHVDIHPKVDGDFRLESDEERSEEEAEMKDAEDEENDFVQNKAKAFGGSSEDSALEASHKARFFAREKLLNERQTRFCRQSLRMTLESEMEDVKKFRVIFPELRTQASDWIPVEPESAADHFPSLQESISFRVINTKKKSDSDWRKIKRFMGDIVEDSAVIFTGGSVLSMSWCKYSCLRSSKQNPKQFLAVSSSRKMDKFQNIHDEPSDLSGLIQIYSCGEMSGFNDVGEVPEMVIGIVHDYGEVWDLAWFPLDAFEDSKNTKCLTRIGLLGAACQDGTIRIWPICDPDELRPVNSLPMYKVHPKVILGLESKAIVGCLRLAIGRTGIVVGGYADGIVAVWSLKSISTPFSKTNGKSFILKPLVSFQAHKTSITALSMCQNSDRYISTSGLDRFIKFWDLESPGNPFESMQKEVCLDSVWPKHWPLTISTFENIVPCSGKGMIKAIRDVYCDKHRSPLAMEGTCWSLSFNEWLNILSGCNNIGEVKIRFMRNMFLADEKFRYRTGNVFCTTELKFLKDTDKEKAQENVDVESCKGSSKKNGKKSKENFQVPRTYGEACKYFGLIFHDFAIEEDSKQKNNSSKIGKKDEQSIEEYPIASVNKVCWNPNYKRFMQLAIGHQCGLIRIKPLNDSKCDDEVLRFLAESERKMGKLDQE